MTKKKQSTSLSSTKTSKSLAAKASTKGKRKATSKISTVKRKKVKNIPNGDDADNSAFDGFTTPEPDFAQASQKEKPIVVDADDDANSSTESDMPIRVENSGAELGKRTLAKMT
jgi:hypothetical protein